MDRHTIGTPHLSATIKAEGGELCSLRDRAGHEFLWQAQAPWHRHAPNLFPIVGRLKDHRLRHRGRDYHLTQHGFARDRHFKWEARDETHCRLSLHDNDDTRAAYPFAFLFTIDYAVTDDALDVTFAVTNTGDEILPAAMGAHPAFRWPLADGIAKNAHQLEFAAPETAPVRRIADGLLLPEDFPTPVAERVLQLREDLFMHDAIIIDRCASKSVTFTAPGVTGVEMSWDDGFRELGLWSRPDDAVPERCADFLCIEPWHGMASPQGFDGEITEKPGIMLIPPGQMRRATWRVRLMPP